MGEFIGLEVYRFMAYPFCYEYDFVALLISVTLLLVPVGTAEVGAPLRWVWVVGGLVHRLRGGLAGPRGWAGSSGGWTLDR